MNAVTSLAGGRALPGQALWQRLATPRRANIALWLIAVAALPPLTARTMPRLFHEGDALILCTAATFAMAALALNILVGYTGQMSLGHAAFLGVGAFASGLVVGRYGLSMALGIPAAGLAGGVAALFIGIPALRLRGLYLAITTIAFGVAVQASIFRISWLTGGNAGVLLPRTVAGETQVNNNADWLAVLLVALLLTVGLVNSDDFPYDTSLQLIIIVVVGGLGSRVGAVAAAFFYFVFPHVFPGWFTGYQVPLGAALLMYTVARHPDGVAGIINEGRERRAMRRLARDGSDDDDIEEQGRLPKLPALPRPSTLPPRPEVARGTAMLSVHDICVRFGGLQAVDSASLEVPRGRIVGLIGPNGAGKTTLFNTISGHVRPQSGTVQFLGRDVSGLPAHQRARCGMSRSFQLIGLAKSMTVLDNMLLAQHVLGQYDMASALAFLPRTARVERELVDRAHCAIAALGFERFTDTPVRNLSHGQQRIVELGCLLVTDPELLMLDEPSAGMSPGAAENLAVRLRELRDEQARTVLLIEHNIPLVLDVCDEIYVLNSGSVLVHGPTETIARRPEVIGAYFGEAVPA